MTDLPDEIASHSQKPASDRQRLTVPRQTGDMKPAERIKRMAALHVPAAFQALCDVMGNPDAPPSARVSAAIAILDRAGGKPGQAVQVTETKVDLNAAFLDALRRANADARGGPVVDVTAVRVGPVGRAVPKPGTEDRS